MTTEIPTVVVADNGPVADAGKILVTRSTLRDHVTVQRQGHTTTFEADMSLPFGLWPSSSFALWSLLAAICHRLHEVSLYEVISCLDDRNLRAVADSFAALCLPHGQQSPHS